MNPDATDLSLVIGGTGMLADATRWLASRSRRTMLIARRASAFASGDKLFAPLDLDWDDEKLEKSLVAAILETGPIGRALIWMHRPEKALPWLAPHLLDARAVIVIGSRGARSEAAAREAGLITVRLGSKVDDGGVRRWLTHEEISAAAIAALEDGRDRVVGELESP